MTRLAFALLAAAALAGCAAFGGAVTVNIGSQSAQTGGGSHSDHAVAFPARP